MSDSIRILSVSTSDSQGGAARAAYRIHKAVQSAGVDSRMLVKSKVLADDSILAVGDFLPHNRLYKAWDWARNKCKNKWQHHLWRRYPEREDYFMSDLRSTDIGDALKSTDYDILHLHWVNLRFLPLGKLPKDKPIVWTFHDSWAFTGVCHVPFACSRYADACGDCPLLHSNRERDLSRQVWEQKQRLYEGLDLHVVCPSNWLAGCARSSSLLRNADIRVIPNPVDTDLYRPGDRDEACRSLGLDPARHHLLFVAMNAVKDRNKGLHLFQEAATHLDGSWDLVILGASESVDSTLDVVNLGIITDNAKLVKAYQAADVTVVPSLSENLSCAIMESLSCGTPVTAFSIGGNTDMIEHKANGYLAREKDSEDLARGIQWCLEHNLDGQLSVAARTKVLDNFTSEIVATRYIELYESLIRP